MKSLLLLWTIVLQHASGQVKYECYDGYSCAKTTISDNSTSMSWIRCWGYHSCSQSPKIKSDGNVDIWCYGSFSCYKSNLIQHIGTSYLRGIECMYSYHQMCNNYA